jgi:hypothetical protein
MGAMLSITGIFGMAAYSVNKRLRELGIRVALGAQPKEVLPAGLGRAVKITGVWFGGGIAPRNSGEPCAGFHFFILGIDLEKGPEKSGP